MHTVLETPTYFGRCQGGGRAGRRARAHCRHDRRGAPGRRSHPGDRWRSQAPLREKGKGKRGGYRVVTYYVTEDVPVFLLALVAKGQRADISQAERNAL